MAYSAGGPPGGPERIVWGRSHDAWLLAIGVVVGLLGLVSVSSSVPDILAAVAILVVVCSFLPSKLGRLAAGGAIAVAVLCVVMGQSSGAVAFAGLALGCTVLARTAASLFPSIELLRTAVSPDRLARESVLLDERASTELTRARRYERPLSVVTVRVGAQGHAARSAATVGHALARELRVTDVVGITEPGVAVAILPETGKDVVEDLVGRLSGSLLAAGLTGSIGTATFPEDAVTWRELNRAAAERSVALVATGSAPNDPTTPLAARLRRHQVVG